MQHVLRKPGFFPSPLVVTFPEQHKLSCQESSCQHSTAAFTVGVYWHGCVWKTCLLLSVGLWVVSRSFWNWITCPSTRITSSTQCLSCTAVPYIFFLFGCRRLYIIFSICWKNLVFSAHSLCLLLLLSSKYPAGLVEICLWELDTDTHSNLNRGLHFLHLTISFWSFFPIEERSWGKTSLDCTESPWFDVWS